MGSPSGPLYLINTAKENYSKLTPDNSSFQIDIIINNAGISINQAISDVTIDAYESTYRINVLGPLLLMQAAEQYLPHDRSGRIVNLSSVSSTLGFVTQSVYGGSKAALEAMTRTWARELASRATVNAVNPGPVSTEMWGATAPEFKAHLKPFIQATPMAQIRPGLDDEKLVKDADAAGGRPGYPEEIAGVVGMLCSAESVWCTGQVVCANGGMRFLM
jgi:3-oxoacyl-[acyl-carrier protein] reductase